MSDIAKVTIDELPADAALLDVREQDEWDSAHADGATHIPLSEIPARLRELPDADPIYVICRTGGRSLQAATWLDGQGIPTVNVEGGMKAWQASGRPMVSSTNAEPVVL